MIIPFPTEWKVIKFMFQTTNQQHSVALDRSNHFPTHTRNCREWYDSPCCMVSRKNTVSMDWFKGKSTGKIHIEQENLWFPVNFPLNQSNHSFHGSYWIWISEDVSYRSPWPAFFVGPAFDTPDLPGKVWPPATGPAQPIGMSPCRWMGWWPPCQMGCHPPVQRSWKSRTNSREITTFGDGIAWGTPKSRWFMGNSPSARLMVQIGVRTCCPSLSLWWNLFLITYHRRRPCMAMQHRRRNISARECCSLARDSLLLQCAMCSIRGESRQCKVSFPVFFGSCSDTIQYTSRPVPSGELT